MTTKEDLQPGTAIDWQSVLPQADVDAIKEKYNGFLLAVRTLNEQEIAVLRELRQGTPVMLVQRLYRLKSSHNTPPSDVAPAKAQAAYTAGNRGQAITPLSVEQKLRRFLLSNKDLRTSYYQASDGKVYAMISSVNLPLDSVTFHQLEPTIDSVEQRLQQIMAADRHCSFALGTPFLPRLTFYALEDGEYAVIVSQPLILAGCWEPRLFLAALLHPDDVQELPPPVPVPSPLEYLQTVERPVSPYWSQRLAGLSTLPELPGYTRPREKPRRLRIIMRQLEEAHFNGLLRICPLNDPGQWLAVLLTMWGLTLQALSKSYDVAFPALLPSGDSELTISRLHAARHPLPVRVQSSPLQRLKMLVAEQYQSLQEASREGLPTTAEVTRIIGHELTYNHILSFQDMRDLPPLAGPEERGITASNLYLNSLVDDLRVTFHLQHNTLSLDVTYYEEALSADCIEIILSRYLQALELAPRYWEAASRDLVDAITPSTHRQLTKQQHALLNSILVKQPLLARVPEEQLKILSVAASIYELPCYEVVQSTGSRQENILLLLSGNVVRQRRNAEGWLVPLNIIGPGELVNELALLEEISTVYGEVVSEKAVLAAIPLYAFRKLLQQTNDFSLDFSNYLLKQLDTYQRLWLTV